MRQETKYIVIHCSQTRPSQKDVEAKWIDRVHRSNGWLKIGYGTVIKRNGEIEKGAESRDAFVKTHGMPGFSPTQGHVASAIPFLGHALDDLKRGNYQYSMFLAKGSLFLGRMTHMSDGESFILEKNH